MRKINIDPNWLREQYESGRTCKDIAIELGVSKSTISAHMKETNIPARTPINRIVNDMKICIGCNQWLSLDNFYFKKSNYDGYNNFCKICFAERKREQDKEYRARPEVKQRLSNTSKKWEEDNRDRYNELHRNYSRKKLKTIPGRLENSMRASIYQSLKGNKNGQHWETIVGYTLEAIKTHIEQQFEPWMTWENLGKYDPKTWNDNDRTTWSWQIDHIKPVVLFQITDVSCIEFKKCWSLDNL